MRASTIFALIIAVLLGLGAAITLKASGILTPREARILRLRYGLQDGESRTLKEVGEMFGLSRFPRIGELSYLLTLAPRGFFWFTLEAVQDEEDGADG